MACKEIRDGKGNIVAIACSRNKAYIEQKYVCPQCKNEEHSIGARYCRICGLRIREVY